jgi:hypothetical protein
MREVENKKGRWLREIGVGEEICLGLLKFGGKCV